MAKNIDVGAFEVAERAGEVRRSWSDDGSYCVWTYTPVTSFSRNWNAVTTMSRGLVTTPDGTIVSRCMPKFWNLGEPEAPTLDDILRHGDLWVAYDKMDGSMITCSMHDGNKVVATKGSFSTWHSAEARAMLGEWCPPEGTTAIFEFIHPKNRIVLDYGGFAGLVLIAATHVESGREFDVYDYAALSDWPGEVVVARRFNILAMIETMKDPEAGENREGFVVVLDSESGTKRVKIKFASYIALHGTLTNLTNVKVWEALRDETIDDLLPLIPDDVRPRVDQLVAEYTDKVRDLLETESRYVDSCVRHLPTRKDQAERIKAERADPRLAFLLLSDHDPMPYLWTKVRPTLDETWKYLN